MGLGGFIEQTVKPLPGFAGRQTVHTVQAYVFAYAMGNGFCQAERAPRGCGRLRQEETPAILYHRLSYGLTMTVAVVRQPSYAAVTVTEVG